MEVRYCPPLALLWSFRPGDGSPASLIHKTYLREVWRERGLLDRARVLAQVVLLWPIISMIAIAWFTAINEEEIRNQTGKSAVRQAVEQLEVSALHGIASPGYYAFELYDDEHRRCAGDYLNRFETKGGLYRLLGHYRRRGGQRGVLDKARYSEICRQHGVPIIPVVAVARRGRVRMEAPHLQGLPRQDLFVKPIRGRGGKGADWWRCSGSDSYTNSRGDATYTSRQLLDHIERLSRSEPYLVNLRARNHPEIADLSTGALCTLRVLSLQNEAGGYEVVAAVLRMAVGRDSVVDNFHAGGIAANVDLASGELGLATGQRPDHGWWDHHPTTGARIQGRKVPFWPDVIDLAQRAHRVFSGYVVIGWDIAILESGLCAVEANGAPDLDIHQRCNRVPLGSQRMGQLLAFHVEQALAARATSAIRPAHEA